MDPRRAYEEALQKEGVGKHTDVPDDKFDKEQLEMGIEVEKEHTDDPAIAKEIAKDHLAELSDYYTRLEKMESEGMAANPRKAFEETLKKQAITLGETFPDVVMYADKDGAYFWTNITIASAGMDPADAKRRIDDAVKVVRKIANALVVGPDFTDLRPGRLNCNGTDYSGTVRIGYRWSGRIGPGKAQVLKAKAQRMPGVELSDKKFWM